ncbi:MAG TPA: VOC family protein [Kofleriaceae bacterium]|jgi:catechol 2,3-dioxygenase-like lactoylglutathione lyase family enzyme
MDVVGIDHVQLAMPPGREADARRFYGELLGFTELEKPIALRARGGLWFQAGPVQLHLGIEPDMRASQKAHPALRVRDLDAWRARLEPAGFEWKPSDELPGTRRAHTRDPFGNRLELIEAEPARTG